MPMRWLRQKIRCRDASRKAGVTRFFGVYAALNMPVQSRFPGDLTKCRQVRKKCDAGHKNSGPNPRALSSKSIEDWWLMQERQNTRRLSPFQALLDEDCKGYLQLGRPVPLKTAGSRFRCWHDFCSIYRLAINWPRTMRARYKPGGN
jgi:hypothetical protein